MSMFKPGRRVALVVDNFDNNLETQGTVTGYVREMVVVKWDDETTKILPDLVFDFMLVSVKGDRNGLAIVE